MQKTSPKNRFKFCPSCGSEQLQYHDDDIVICSKCGFHLYINSAAAVAGIIQNSENKILFLKRAHEPKKGYLDLPGGFVDINETAENALIREIKEELSLEIIDYTYLCSYPNTYTYKNLTYFTTDLGFTCKVKDFDYLNISSESTDYCFLTVNELNFEDIAFESIKNILRKYLELL